MITFGRVSILIVSTVLTGCVGCPVVGQVTATKLHGAWFEDKSTCECHLSPSDSKSSRRY